MDINLAFSCQWIACMMNLYVLVVIRLCCRCLSANGAAELENEIII